MSTHIPIVCDMTDATDTVPERLAEYRQLFRESLVGRERTAAGIRLRFRADPGVEDHVRDLAAREKACCGFFDFEVAAVDGEVRWDAEVVDDPIARQILEEFYEFPDTIADEPAVLRDRFVEAGLQVVVADGHGGTRAATDADLGLA
jgi:hypothetical protein